MDFLIYSKKYGIKVCQVDDEDAGIIIKNTWQLKYSKGIFYARCQKGQYLHRMVINARINLVDHADRNGLNNKKENLRICTKSQNGMNRPKQINNTTGFKGVHFNRYAKKYQAKIQINSKQIHIGYFLSKEEAFDAYCEASKKYHGNYGRSI
jgi:hypothetical protein